MAKQEEKSPIQIQQLKVVGMVKDTSPSGLNPPDSMFKSNSQYAYDIQNMRFSPIEGNTLFDIVNEKGNIKLNIENITTSEYESQNIPNTTNLQLEGTPIGINIIDNELVLFTTETSGVPVDIPTENAILNINDLKVEILDSNITL